MQEADIVFCVSEDEARFIAELAPGTPTFILPGVVETPAEVPGFDERRDLLFFGGFLAGALSPNTDSLTHLIEHVLPPFWEEHPEVVLNVIGADVSDSIRALEGPRIRIVGYVEDPLAWLTRARLHVNPMRFGAGLKQKFLDSLAAGLPFVTTKVGAEGFPLGDVEDSWWPTTRPSSRGSWAASTRIAPSGSGCKQRLLELAATRFDRDSFQRTLIEAMTYVGVAPPPAVR